MLLIERRASPLVFSGDLHLHATRYRDDKKEVRDSVC